ncbi:MAG TPA: hypothetical protein VN688_04520 [Gemmataceae bacterium]|nr:hypothetical protein [Gemmataceae bacterium]
MSRQIEFRASVPDKYLLQEVQRIAEHPAGDSPEVKKQIATLAKAIVDLAESCRRSNEAVAKVLAEALGR